MIKHFGVLARSILLQIFNLSWITGKLPTICKMSVIVPILKPGKDAASCKNFRPISLTSTLRKIMEKIIHSRIMKWLIKRKVLHFYQTAYRSQHSTVDRLFYLVQSIIDGFQEIGKLQPYSLIFLRPLTGFGDKNSLKFCIPWASRATSYYGSTTS
ncbi:reverse transcriptase domain-containing protein [Trichonephila clavata]|uniref:Reverse transcriptase domain-containing protein n=1 Tax=Trichonephila clavata TaxID=2740835 RepID=A0A8X6LHC9_TRICU|nr:reverse transcriptase domain-containing protein [Trichonephila clavata]